VGTWRLDTFGFETRLCRSMCELALPFRIGGFWKGLRLRRTGAGL
jgi:hypothetical protein